jgi:hypothetical protein
MELKDFAPDDFVPREKLANSGVPQAIVAGFEASTGHLGDRLIAAMRAFAASKLGDKVEVPE